MPVPSPRNKILPARGNFADLSANVASLVDGEICYAIDQDTIYMKEGSTLVPVGTGGGGAVDSVNGQTGVVVLDADDISDAATTNKYTTQGDIDKLAGIEGGATGDQTPAEIKAAYESNTNTNAFTDAEQTKLAGIQAGAQVNTVTSVAGKTGAVSLVKGDVGLGNVDNTSDANKPVSTAQQTALNAKADLVGGVVPTSQIPAIALTEYLGVAANEAAMLAFVGQEGDWCNRSDTSSTFVITGSDPSVIGGWTELSYPASSVESVNGQTGVVTLGAADVGAATAAQGTLADSAVQPGDNVSDLVNDAGYITLAQVPADAVASVNGQTGVVALGPADVGAATAAQGATADTALQPTDSVGDLSDVDITTTAPVDGQALVWNGVGGVFVPATVGGGGGGTPAGSNTQIQYNDGGASGASVDLTWDDTAKQLGVGGDITIADKIIHGGDTDTAIRFPAANQISFETGGVEHLRINPFGQLLHGLNTTSSSANAIIQGAPGTGILLISRSSNNPGVDVGLGRIRFSDSNHGTAAQVSAVRDGGTWTTGTSQPTRLEFSVTPNGSSSAVEALRINSSGAFGVNGANFGTAGQALVSNGSAAAPTWQTIGGGASATVYYNRRPALYNGSLFYKTAAATLSVVAGAVLNGYVYETVTAVTMPSHVSSVDYAIWQHPTTGALVGSSNFLTAPAGAPGGSIVGGYHYIPSGRPRAVNGGTLTTTPEILEYSLWDLTWRPACADPRGMTCIDGRFWCDIYLCGATSYAGTTFSAVPSSRIALTIADDNSPAKIPSFYGGNGTTAYSLSGGNSPGSWYNFTEVAHSFGKRLMFSWEFQAAAFGALEQTSRGTDAGTTKWERASKWGLAQATGVMWSFAADRMGIYTSGFGNSTGGRGGEYADAPRVLAVGGSYDYTTVSGSRGANWNFPPYSGAYNYGARFACDHRVSG